MARLHGEGGIKAEPVVGGCHVHGFEQHLLGFRQVVTVIVRSAAGDSQAVGTCLTVGAIWSRFGIEAEGSFLSPR